VSSLFGVSCAAIGLAGSRMLGRNLDSDWDVIVRGVECARASRERLARLVVDPDRRVAALTGSGHEQRRFRHRGDVICPGFVYGRRQEDPLGLFNVVPGEIVREQDVVVDDSHSQFLPALYRLETGRVLITYCPAHRLLLRRGDRFACRARTAVVDGPLTSGVALVVDSGSVGMWIQTEGGIRVP